MGRIEEIVVDETADLPPAVREICRDLIERIADLTVRTDKPRTRIAAMSRQAETTRRLQTMPGVGPILSLAIKAFAPVMESFWRGRDFAAWLGLVPLQKSSGANNDWAECRRWGSATSADC